MPTKRILAMANARNNSGVAPGCRFAHPGYSLHPLTVVVQQAPTCSIATRSSNERLPQAKSPALAYLRPANTRSMPNVRHRPNRRNSIAHIREVYNATSVRSSRILKARYLFHYSRRLVLPSHIPMRAISCLENNAAARPPFLPCRSAAKSTAIRCFRSRRPRQRRSCAAASSHKERIVCSLHKDLVRMPSHSNCLGTPAQCRLETSGGVRRPGGQQTVWPAGCNGSRMRSKMGRTPSLQRKDVRRFRHVLGPAGRNLPADRRLALGLVQARRLRFPTKSARRREAAWFFTLMTVQAAARMSGIARCETRRPIRLLPDVASLIRSTGAGVTSPKTPCCSPSPRPRQHRPRRPCRGTSSTSAPCRLPPRPLVPAR
jgi:hypothetical protein